MFATEGQQVSACLWTGREGGRLFSVHVGCSTFHSCSVENESVLVTSISWSHIPLLQLSIFDALTKPEIWRRRRSLGKWTRGRAAKWCELALAVQLPRPPFRGYLALSFSYKAHVIRLGSAHRLCGLVVRVPGYRSTGPGSIPGAASFSEK
jgi:hypothetical protein